MHRQERMILQALIVPGYDQADLPKLKADFEGQFIPMLDRGYDVDLRLVDEPMTAPTFVNGDGPRKRAR